MNPVLRVVVAFLSSMRLSVVLVVMLGLLTWFGTLAQVDTGLYEVQKQYFESWWVMCRLPFSMWFPSPWADGGWVSWPADGAAVLNIPMPGAYPLMALLFLNLIVGGMVRLKLGWRNVGVLVCHVGIGLLLVAGFVKLHYSESGHLRLYEAPADGGGAGNRQTSSAIYTSFHDYELALLQEDGDTIVERVVPEATIARARGDVVVELPCDDLPFRIEVSNFEDNAEVLPKGPMFEAPTPVVDGVFLQPRDLAKERELNEAGCYVAVVTDAGERHEGILRGLEMRPFTMYRFPFTFEVDGVRYGLDLRRVMREMPFEVRLDEFRKTDHPGTMTPADFRSFVTVREGQREAKVQIYMNQPLRKDGFVLFQTSWGPQDMSGPPWFSVFEVAKNPSDQWPHIACWVIAAGLAIHFSIKLVRFLNSSAREALSS